MMQKRRTRPLEERRAAYGDSTSRTFRLHRYFFGEDIFGSGKRVLNVGVGSSDLRAAQATVFSLDPQYPEIADERVVRGVCAVAETLPFPDGTFDHVVFFFSCKALRDKHRSIEEGLRVTRLGGSVMFAPVYQKLLHPAHIADFGWRPSKSVLVIRKNSNTNEKNHTIASATLDNFALSLRDARL